jgi:hypothetical protein
MRFSKWMNSRMKKLSLVDMPLIKLSVFAFALMAAKLWEPLLALEWYWYAAIFILAVISPMSKMLRK